MDTLNCGKLGIDAAPLQVHNSHMSELAASELAAVDIADFQAGSKLMGEAYAIKSGDQFERAKQSISRYCYAKFSVSEDHPETDEALKAQALADTLVFRLLFYAQFMREHWPLLMKRNLMRGNTQNKMIEEVAAYVPVVDDIEPETMLAEVDRRLGREHIPVTAQELAEIDQELENIASNLIEEELVAEDDEFGDFPNPDSEISMEQALQKMSGFPVDAFGSLGEEPYRRETPKIGRNEPCFCGSGKKYKKCHGAALS